MFSKKSQAAVDFILTYSWAILGVLALVGILAYFGVLSPSKFAPDECVFLQPNFECASSAVNAGSVTLVVINTQERDVNIDKISIKTCTSNPNKALPSGGEETFLVECTNGIQKDKFKEDFEIGYTESDTKLAKKAFGIINTLVE